MSLADVDRHSLIGLRTHWDSHYEISLGDGAWLARSISRPTVILTADSSSELLGKIMDDFAEMAASATRATPRRAGRSNGADGGKSAIRC